MNNEINKLILCFIPTNLCNLRCDYCIVTQTKGWDRDDIIFKYPVEHIIRAFNKERMGGLCYINLTAQGETLLYKDIVPLTKGLLEEGHYVEIVTNATISKSLDEILTFPDTLLSHLFFKCSFHYEQIKDKPIERIYWNNLNKIKRSPCSFTVEIMPHDEISKDIDDICQRCVHNVGAVCHATVGRNGKKNSKELLTNMSQGEYVKLWSRLNSSMFRLKMNLFGVKRKEFCYAGKWSLLIDIASGETSQCYGRMNTQNIFKDLSKPISFIPVGFSCTQAFCFNGHAHIAWGIIPELKSPTYYEVRNRTSLEGDNWVKSDCEKIFKQKLLDNNIQYTRKRKLLHSIFNPIYLFISLFHDPHSVKRKVIKFYRIVRGKF